MMLNSLSVVHTISIHIDYHACKLLLHITVMTPTLFYSYGTLTPPDVKQVHQGQLQTMWCKIDTKFSEYLFYAILFD